MDPVELVIKCGFELFSVFLYPGYTDKDVARDLTFFLAGIKGHDVGKGVVVEILDIDLAKVLVGAKDKIQLTKCSLLF